MRISDWSSDVCSSYLAADDFIFVAKCQQLTMLAWPVILAATIQRELRRVMPPERDGLLAGKAAFITGPSQRIGRATALGLARPGADLRSAAPRVGQAWCSKVTARLRQ